MLKYPLALLLMLNAALLAWQWDAFARWGYGPNPQREPERLLQQVRPEALRFEIPSTGAGIRSAQGVSQDAGAPASISPQASDASPTATADPVNQTSEISQPAASAPRVAPPLENLTRRSTP